MVKWEGRNKRTIDKRRKQTEENGKKEEKRRIK
jgi:hypothetical protein